MHIADRPDGQARVTDDKFTCLHEKVGVSHPHAAIVHHLGQVAVQTVITFVKIECVGEANRLSSLDVTQQTYRYQLHGRTAVRKISEIGKVGRLSLDRQVQQGGIGADPVGEGYFGAQATCSVIWFQAVSVWSANSIGAGSLFSRPM